VQRERGASIPALQVHFIIKYCKILNCFFYIILYSYYSVDAVPELGPKTSSLFSFAPVLLYVLPWNLWPSCDFMVYHTKVISIIKFVSSVFSCKCKSNSMKVIPSVFFSENVIAITMKFTWMIHASFAVMRLFFYSVTIFSALLPALSKTLYTRVVKLLASANNEHISKTLFQFVVFCKMISM
jgi:hypothetical protein